MNQPKINPRLLRLFIIFPNILAYCLMFGIVFFVVTNYEELKAAEALNFWLILLAVFIPITLLTTYSIIKRIRAGAL
ncbi:acyl-phosphate glycerol 3-phosphate acyltransferase [Ureibacillus thermosphaericus]|uniref:acyl-phosphate glycerol 3-phosphate acyltransferase n=1 Tax=Ureibacillus thermosphaericus TaxID=51173 RepID=UPI00168EFCD2|nr:acyl-phosphate glycerol 3-phosphate acyltransferase [Lysinibacillus sp.]